MRALGERVGSLLHIRNPYFVQVKSEKTSIEYSGPASAGWLLDLRSPLLICYVSKRENHVEIYQTLELAMHATFGIPRNVVLSFEPAEWPPAAPTTQMSDLNVRLGKPILSFDVARLADARWIEDARTVLSSWIEWDQNNIDFVKATGFNFCAFPTTYEMAVPLVATAGTVRGNFRLASEKAGTMYGDGLLKLLAHGVLNVTSRGNAHELDALLRAIGQLITILSPTVSWSRQLLEFVANSGLRHLKMSGTFTVASKK